MAQANNERITADPDEMSMKDLFLKLRGWRKYLQSKWIVILIACLLGGSLGLTYSFLKKPIYVADLS